MAGRTSDGKKGKDGRMTSPASGHFDGARVDAAVRKSMRNVRILHKRMGVGLVGWKDGKIVEIPPEEIQIDDVPGEGRR